MVAAIVAACANDDGRIEQIERRTTELEARARIVAESVAKAEPRWWCSTHICTRKQDECTRMVPIDDKSGRKAMDCESTRLAYCPVDGMNLLQCTPTLDVCERRAAEQADGYRTRCIGVE